VLVLLCSELQQLASRADALIDEGDFQPAIDLLTPQLTLLASKATLSRKVGASGSRVFNARGGVSLPFALLVWLYPSYL
jgi:hypothetical protein